MSNFNIISGEELVRKGLTGHEASLPEVGLKDVVPNGSWLEQKQIQSALETKKGLIEIERIEKIGSISQAEWKKDLNLAEVTQKVGGYWKFLGHNVGSILYLNPEEALYLMEINCLLLKLDGVKVSLQQANSLLLQENISLLKYKVYASLSRIGYKVFRYKPNIKTEKQSKPTENINNKNNIDKTPVEEVKSQNFDDLEGNQSSTGEDCKQIEEIDIVKNHVQSYNTVYKSYQDKLVELKHRKFKQCKSVTNFFDTIPDLIEKCTFTLKVPEAIYVPENMCLKESYTVNLKNSQKRTRTASNSYSYSSSDEPNGNHVKRLKASNTEASTSNLIAYRRNSAQNLNYQNRPFYSLRPQSSLNFFNINMLFQRPLAHQIFFSSPFQNFGPQIFERPVFLNYSLNMNRWNRFPTMIHSNNRKMFLSKIKQLAQRLKMLLAKGNFNQQSVQALQSLINTYNTRYKSNMRLGPCFEIISGYPVVETIELDLDDDEPQNKKRKENNKTLETNLESVKQMAHELKKIEMFGKSTAKHRRTFSKLLKTFNRCYNVDYYLDPSFELKDKRHITLDSSSDTDCIIQEDVIEKPQTRHKKTKKLKNPFNILKRLSEKRDAMNDGASCSSHNNNEVSNVNHSELIKDNFSKNWIPNENEFGRVELARNHIPDPLFDMKKSVLLYDFAKFKKFENWLGLKISFLESLKETIAEFHENASVCQNDFDMECLVKPQDCHSTGSILEKLRIIQTNQDTVEKATLSIDFDVYNRDVVNFRKTDPPTPHFRIICLEESQNIPSAAEIETLYSKYSQNIPIVFALVSISSISYLQIKPMQTPIHSSNI